MDFSDTSGLTGVVEDTHFLTQTDATSYPLKDIARNANRWIYKAVVKQIKANKHWDFDDTNHTDHPIATATLVNGQQDYTLPTDLLKLGRVEILDGNGDYYVINPIDKVDIKPALSEFNETNGLPVYYDQIGESLFLYPAPDTTEVTAAAGLKIVYTRDIDAYTDTDTTQEAGIPEPFHRIASLGASHDYMQSRGDFTAAQSFRTEIEILLEELSEFAADMNETVKTTLRPAHRTSSYL